MGETVSSSSSRPVAERHVVPTHPECSLGHGRAIDQTWQKRNQQMLISLHKVLYWGRGGEGQSFVEQREIGVDGKERKGKGSQLALGCTLSTRQIPLRDSKSAE